MTRKTKIAWLFAGSCALALTAQANTSLAAEAAQAAQPSSVGEVVVTAQRRQQRLIDVPIAMSVISSKQLEQSNYTGLTNLALIVPSLQYNAYLGGGFQVRGIGTQSVNLTTEQDVAIVVDDVVQGLPELTFAAPSYQALTDIDRVEVLKGPQGTLFGKNSSVGVLQIITKKPQLGAYSADGSVSAATRGEYNVQANVNVPIGQDVAARISAFEYHHDGFIKNVANGEELGGYDQYGARGKLLWKPTNDLSVYFIGDYIKTTAPGNGAWTLRSCGSGFGAFSVCDTDEAYGVHPGPRNRQLAVDGPTPATTETKSGSMHIDYNLGKDTLTSVTAYNSMVSDENVDVDGSPRPILSIDRSLIKGQQFTQEVRLSSPSNQFFDYTVGAYVYNVQTNYHNLQGGTFGFEPDDATTLLSNGFAGLVTGGETVLNTNTTSYAVFGQGALHPTSKLELIGGVRYSHDDVGASVSVLPVANLCEVGFAFGGPCHSVSLPSSPEDNHVSADNFSGKVTLKYNFTSRINAYATVATGYKGPAIAYSALTPLSAVKPETSMAYEIGIKSELFDRRLTLSADAFYEHYKNFQADTAHINIDNPSASNFQLANAGGLDSKGVEADATWIATNDLTFSGSVAYNPTNFTNFLVQCQNQYVNPPTAGSCATIAGISVFNAKGYALPQAPELSYTLGGDYHHMLAGDYLFQAHANWVWKSSTYTVVADRNTIQAGYGLLGASVSIGPADQKWTVSVFARNLLDQYFVSGIFPTFLDNGSQAGPRVGYSNIPNLESGRTVGVKLSFKIGS
jgi:iron complex outermembrane receptor protein